MKLAIASSATGAPRDRDLPGALRVLCHQLRFDGKMQRRNPAAVVFTLLLPIGFLVLFAASADGPRAQAAFVPASIIIGVFSGSLTNLAITLTYLREYGMLKQARLQPLPPWCLLLSKSLTGGALAVLSAAIVALAGWVLYGATPTSAPTLVLAVVLGTAIGSGLGLLVSAAIRSEVAAAPVANAVTLPLLILAGAFVSLESLSPVLQDVARWLPGWGVTALAGAAYGTVSDVGPAAWANAVVWTALALAAGIRLFRWAPGVRR